MRLLVPVLLLVSAHSGAEPVVLQTDPAALAKVSADFASVVPEPVRKAIERTVRADVAALDRADPSAGVGIAGNAHRLFDVRWLSAKSTRFELVGIANRMDRAAVHAEGCGEIRLVYRLRYQHGAVGSRLPMTVLVTFGAGGDCRALARSWDPAQPLAAPWKLTQVAINYQLVRWPSAVRPDFGGHAEYVLRAFFPDGKPKKLENTPRPKAGAALREWVVANARQIDEGTAILPDALATERSSSVSPHGLARLANRPYGQQLTPADLAGIDFSAHQTAKTPEMLIRRLDEMTCAGCHQTRAVAGFHLLGQDGPEEVAGNALAVAASPHTAGDLARRRAWVQAILDGKPGDRRQPFASRTHPTGRSGDACNAEWTCTSGLTCVDGACQADPPDLGEACEQLRFDAKRDRATLGERRACAKGRVCEATKVGFPGGMCAGSCSDTTPAGACGAIAILSDFNACLARKTPFPDCLARHTRPALLRACGQDLPCRDDFICSRTSSGKGACIPPYFLFQMRVDGHPAP